MENKMPNPSDYKDRESFMNACIPHVMGEGKTKEQAAGQCSGMWDSKVKKVDVEVIVKVSESLPIIKNDEQQIMFGWFSVATKGGVDVVDTQQDIVKIDTLEKAAYKFVQQSRIGGEMHKAIGVGTVVESMVFTQQKQDALGIKLGFEGWWGGIHFPDKNIWKKVKEGTYKAFSIGGAAIRREITHE
jgi:hypothetical protein